MSGAEYTRVWQIQSIIHPKPDDLLSTARFFVREGPLVVWDDKQRKKKTRYFFLFNDILLLCKKGSSKRYALRIHITLRSPSVSVENVAGVGHNNEFRLHCRSRSFILYAPTADARDDWIADLNNSIHGTHPNDLKDASLKKKTDALVKGVPEDEIKQTGGDDSSSEEEGSSESEEKKPVKTKSKPKPKSNTLAVEAPRNRSKSSSGTRSKTSKVNAGSQKQKVGPLLDFDPFAPANVSSNPNPLLIQSSPGFAVPPMHSNPNVNPFLSSPGVGGNPFQAQPQPQMFGQPQQQPQPQMFGQPQQQPQPQMFGQPQQQNFLVPNANQNPFMQQQAPNQFNGGAAANPFLNPQQPQVQNFDAQARARAQTIAYQPTGGVFNSQPAAPNPFGPQTGQGYVPPFTGAPYGGASTQPYGQSTNNLFF